MTEPSAAEFARFVQEAYEQRARADALSVANAELRTSLVTVVLANEELGEFIASRQHALCTPGQPGLGIVSRQVLATMDARSLLESPPDAYGASLLASIDRLKKAWDALTDCVNEFEPEDMGACGERREELDEAILGVIKPRGASPRAAGEPEAR